MYYLIYETTNLINGKLYRGAHQTENIDDGYLGSGKLITRAINKHGKEKFSRSILCYCDTKEDMICKEAEYVDEAWVNDKTTYNLQTGGLYYGILNEESKQKISKTLKAKYASGEITAKGPVGQDPRNKGLTASEDSRIDSGPNTKKSKVPWNKGKTGQQVAWNKGLPAKKFICPHCSKEIGGASNYKRWHGDNCKLKL